MARVRVWTWTAVAAFTCVAQLSAFASQSVDQGFQWLSQQVQPAGTVIGEANSVAGAFQVRSETLTTLRQLGSAPTPLADKLQQDSTLAIEVLARNVLALAPMGRNVAPFLASIAARQNADGGWGGADGYQSNPLDTAVALQALRAAGQTQSLAIGRAIAYLQASQLGDGSFVVGDAASVYVTAEALRALSQFSASYGVATQVASARAWLVARQSQGAYPDTFQNAVALLALLGSSVDTAPMVGPMSAIRATQLPNGSWASDPYITALALRALAAAEEVLPPATTGQVTGSVVELGSNAAIAGATVTLTGSGSATVTTDGAGSFVVVGLAPGTYSLQVAKSGYTSGSVSANVAAGATTHVGSIALTPATTTATLKGTVRDGASGLPLEGALVAVAGGPSATTDSVGAYQIAGLAPGAAQITVTKTGYQSINATAQFAAGAIYTFSPSLYAPGQTPTDATLRGKVAARATSQPIAGATITVGARSATTSATGDFEITALPAGTVTIGVAAAGYQPATLNGTLVSGVNDAGLVLLDLNAASATATGRVFDASTNLPIGGANVSVQGAGLAATTNSNGNYVITGITTAAYTLAVAAPGYRPATVNVANPVIADAIVDVAMQRASTGNVSIRRVATDLPSYAPFATMEIEVELVNAQATPVEVSFNAKIVNSAGQVVGTAPLLSAVVPGGSVPYEVELEHHTQSLLAGTYSIVVTAFDASGLVLDESSTSFAISSLVRMGGGVTLDPPITQSGSNQPIRLTAIVANRGNATIPAGQVELSVTLLAPEPGDGESARVELLPGVIRGGLVQAPLGAGYDAQGNYYLVNRDDRRVIRISPSNAITVVATLPASFTSPNVNVFPMDAKVDAAGNVYVLNQASEIFTVSPTGAFSRKATGTSEYQSSFDRDAAGNFYLTTGLNGLHQIIKVPVSGANTVYPSAGLVTPNGIARGGDGNMYVTNRNTNSIARVTPSGQITPFVLAGLNGPMGITVGADGFFYVSNSGNGTVSKVSPAGTVTAYASGIGGTANDLRFDAAGNLFVTSFADDVALYRVAPGGGLAQPFARTLFPSPHSMQYDAAGNLFASNGSQLLKKDAADQVSSVYFGISGARGVAIAPNGDAFVASSGSGEIYRIAGGVRTVLASGLATPHGLALAPSGTLYATESGGAGNRIVSFDTSLASPPKVVVAQSLVNTPKWIASNVAGERFVLNGDSLAQLPVAGGGGFIASGAPFSFVATAFAPTSDGGFLVQESNALKKVSAAGAVQTITSTLPTLAPGIALDASGRALVAVASGNATYPSRSVLRIDASGTIQIVATLNDSPVSITTDEAGGLFAALSAGHIARVDAAGAVTAVTSTALNPVPSRMAYDATAGKLYLTSVFAGVRTFTLADRSVTTIPGLTQVFSAIAFAGGQILVANANARELSVLTPAGQLTGIAAGFTTPQPIVLDGTRLVFSDSTNTFTLTPGGYPNVVLRERFAHLAARAGSIYGTRGDVKVYSFIPGAAASQAFATAPVTGATMQGMAIRSDGLLSVTSDRDNSVWSFDASGQLVASYYGIGGPRAVAVDTDGNVYVSASSTGRILRFGPQGGQSSVFVSLNAQGMAFDPTGYLYSTSLNTVSRTSPNGAATENVATVAPGAGFVGVLPEGAVVHVVDSPGAMVRRIVAGEVTTLAGGLSTPKATRVEANGNVLVASQANGSVLRLVNGQLTLVAAGMTFPSSLALGANGEIFVGGGSGHLYSIVGNAAPKEIGNIAAIYGGNGMSLDSLATSATGEMASTTVFLNQVDRIGYTAAGSGPVAGTPVIAPLLRSVGEIGVDAMSATIDFGTFVPPYAGDYQIKVRPISAQVSGELLNVLHVGPHSTAQMGAMPSLVAPGDAAVNVSVIVDGADFTTFARADPRGVRLAASNLFGIFMTAFGSDSAGNIFMTIGNTTLYRFAPGASAPVTELTMPSAMSMRGAIPVDDSQRLYVNGGATGAEVHQVTPRVGATPPSSRRLATLPETIRSMVRASDNSLYALSPTGIYHVMPAASGDWPFTVVPTGTLATSGLYISIDGKDNLYVQSGSAISVYPADGTRENLIRPDAAGEPTWEGEGMPMSGDCADNLLVAPYSWARVGQSGEEHTMVQVIGRTGRIAQIFDGAKTLPSLTDMDSLVYDRFSSTLMLATDLNGGMIFRLPITCGAIDTDLHLVFPASQPATGFSVAPKAVFTRADGQHEYVWGFKDVTNAGKQLTLGTTLPGVRYGETRAVASDAFLSFQNAFASGTVTVPVTIPTVHADGLVDIAVSTGAVQYQANADVNPLIVLTNRDVAQAKFGALTVEFTDPQGTRIAILGQQPVTIPANGSLSLVVPFNTSTILTGEYRIRATLAGNGGAELAAGGVSFYIVAGAATLVHSVTTERQVYEANDEVLVSARVRNVSLNAIASGIQVQVTVRNPGGQQIFSQQASIATLAPQALKDSAFGLALASAAAGSYIVEMTASQDGTPIGTPQIATFSVLSTADTGTGLAGAVTATRLANAGDPVAIRATLMNQGNAALANLPVVIRVVNPQNGNILEEWTSTITIGAGSQAEINQGWSASGAGTFVITASATVGGRVIPLGQESVTIGALQSFAFTALANVPVDIDVESNTVTIAGLAAPVAISVANGQYRIGNGSWSAAPGVVRSGDTVTVRVHSSPTGGVTTAATLTVGSFSTAFQVTTLQASDSTPDAFSFSAQSNVAPSVVATSNTVTISGIDVAVPISITGGEYRVNGGAWTSAPSTVVNGDSIAVRVTSSATLGATVTATLTVANVSGAFSVTTLAADSTVDPFAFTSQVDVPLSSVRTSNTVTISGINVPVAIRVAGGEYNVNGGAFTSADGTVSAGSVVSVRITASANYGTPKAANLTVAQFSTGFSVTTLSAPDPVVTHAFSAGARVLVLVSCKNAQGGEDVACSAARRNFLDPYLTALGVEHKIVVDTEVFRSELRCGRWNTYWISGGASKLKDTLASEVREAVFRGEALIVDGVRDASSSALDTVTGVTFVSTDAQAASVLINGPLLPTGTFTTTGGTQRFSLQGGVAQATFTSASGDPAIVSRGYGSGKALHLAFDLVATLMAQPSSSVLQSTLDAAIDSLPLAPSGTFTGDAYAAIESVIVNPTSDPKVIEVVATLPSGVTFVSSTPSPTSQTTTVVKWRVTVPAQQSATIAWAIRAPQVTGTSNVSLQSNRIDGASSTTIGTFTLPVVVTALPERTSQSVAALNALALTVTAEQQARGRAVTALQDAQTKSGLGLYEAAIGKYLSADGELLSITSVPTTANRVSIDLLMKEVSRKWCRGGSACVVGTATGSPYNVMAFGASSFTNGSASGSIGVGGNATLSSYTVAADLSGDGARLIGGGNVGWSNGSVGQGGSGVIRMAGTSTVNQNVGRRELTTGTAVEDWNAIRTEQLARADRYAAMAGTAATKSAGNAVNCTGANATWNVCTITSAQLTGAQTINLNYPATSGVLVNVTGTGSITFTNGQTRFNNQTLQNSALAKQVIFNLANLTGLTVDGWGWGGTLLAPRATVTHRNSMIDGQAVFNTVTSTGSYKCSGTYQGATP
ncbi:MAG: carboxypeptidase regulatory-like domain-containing protein [Casimicrobiaceae bacterium]